MAEINLALVGCGGYGSAYVREIAASPDAKLLVACDAKREHAQAAADKTGAQVCTDWERALDVPGLDGVVIATPNHLHSQMACGAAERGLHVLCEKPMATTLDDARRMVRACREAGVVLMIGLSSRYDQAFKRGLELTRSGELGDPELITNVYHYTLGPVQPGRTWHNDPELLGGGALIQMGIHLIDRVAWFAGSEPRSVYALLRKASGRWADNVALCTIAFEGGLLGQIEIAGVASARRNEMAVHLSRGEIVVERRHVRWYDGEWHVESLPADRLALEVEDFCRSIREGTQPACSGEVALPAHELCFAAYRSAAEGRPLMRREGEYV